MAEVILSNFVDDKLDNLIDILFQKEYFGFRSDAKIYVDALYTFIYTIPQQKRHICKNPKHGFYYCRYKQNHNTTWYITFDTENEIYLVKNIFNNHTLDYPVFIKSMQ